MRANRAATTLQIALDFGALPRCTIVEWQRREWGEERIQLGVLRASPGIGCFWPIAPEISDACCNCKPLGQSS